jgi:NitT/TauT family transport system permease protein
MMPTTPESRFARWIGRYALAIDLIVLLALWQGAAVSLDRPFLPTPDRVLMTFIDEMRAGDLGGHFVISLRRVALSIAAGVMLAAPLAILSAQSRWVDRFVRPLMTFAYPAPKVVFLPLIVLFFGLGDESRIFLIGLVIFFQVYVIIRDAAGQVPAQTLESISSLGAGRWQVLRYVYLPISIPAVITALKVSAGTAIAVLYIAEAIGGRTGLGYYIAYEYGSLGYVRMYAGIVAMSLLGLMLFVIFELLERRLTRWQRA